MWLRRRRQQLTTMNSPYHSDIMSNETETGGLSQYDPSASEAFGAAFSDMQCAVHATAMSKGWWDNRSMMENACAQYEKNVYPTPVSDFSVAANQISALMLVVTELAEAVEAIRHGNPPDDKIPTFSGAEAECADAVIRLMDMAEFYGWRLSEAIIAKAEMNKGRQKMHGGKKA